MYWGQTIHGETSTYHTVMRSSDLYVYCVVRTLLDSWNAAIEMSIMKCYHHHRINTAWMLPNNVCLSISQFLKPEIKVIFHDTLTHTHTFNGPFSGTTRVSQYQKGKTNLDFTEARDSEWQWHQLVHMQVCTSLQTDNHASTPPLIFHNSWMQTLKTAF